MMPKTRRSSLREAHRAAKLMLAVVPVDAWRACRCASDAEIEQYYAVVDALASVVRRALDPLTPPERLAFYRSLIPSTTPNRDELADRMLALDWPPLPRTHPTPANNGNPTCAPSPDDSTR